MICSHCATGKKLYALEESSTSYLGRLSGGKYVIIENVPCLTCPNCGEEYFSTTVAERIDSILDEQDLTNERVEIKDFANAA